MRGPSLSRPHSSLTTLIRFAFRIIVIGIFAAVWPNKPIADAVAALCAVMAAACAAFAIGLQESIRSRQLNHWDEAAVLFGIALLLYAFS
jgi:hypothetical protein